MQNKSRKQIKEELGQAEIKREYTFGREAAQLFCTDKGFFVVNIDTDEYYSYSTYTDAAGKAKMIAAQSKSW